MAAFCWLLPYLEKKPVYIYGLTHKGILHNFGFSPRSPVHQLMAGRYGMCMVVSSISPVLCYPESHTPRA